MGIGTKDSFPFMANSDLGKAIFIRILAQEEIGEPPFSLAMVLNHFLSRCY